MMRINQIDGNITLLIKEATYKIIDKDGQIQLKDMYRLLDENHSNVTLKDEEILFDEKIPEDLQNGLSLFLKELFSKVVVEADEK